MHFLLPDTRWDVGAKQMIEEWADDVIVGLAAENMVGLMVFKKELAVGAREQEIGEDETWRTHVRRHRR
jgi:hypothetical protein